MGNARERREPAATLQRVTRSVIGCRRCPRLVEHREHVGREKRRAFRDQEYWARAVPAFGDPAARLLVVGLAPAAHGANRTGRMFTGDRSGEWLYRALHRAGFANRAISTARDDGLRLHAALVTAAARCAPPDNKPLPEELLGCRPYLVEELHALRRHNARPDAPLVIVALGAIAFRSVLDTAAELGVTLPRPRPRFGHAAEVALADDLVLLCSYHPSQQNTQTGVLTEEMLDAVFSRARRLVSGYAPDQ